MGAKVLLAIVVSYVAIAVCRGSSEFKDNSIAKYYIYRNGNYGCREPGVELRERNASAIFSGTIRDLEPSPDDPDALRATVEVKRVLKGGHVLSRSTPQRIGPDDGRTYVTVDGIGSPKICRSFARKRDTRIFLVNKGANGELALNSSLERITMENINRIDAAVVKNGLPPSATGVVQSRSYRNTTSRSATSLQTSRSTTAERVSDERTEQGHGGSIDPDPESLVSSTTELTGISSDHDLHDSLSSIVTLADILDNKFDQEVSDAPIVKRIHKEDEVIPPKEDPCDDHRCLFGGSCVADTATGGATCKCPAEVNCSTSDEDSVCGSDGTTYNGECRLQIERCKQQMDITVLQYRACDDGESSDPCLAKTCSFGAQCIASLDGLTARCQCPEKCDNFGDSVGSDPVCGSDGRDYSNTCEMRKKGCEDMRDVEKKFDGRCDPCRGFSCPFGQLCQLDSARRPVCRCGEVCPMVFDPVCGSNGKTYANECLMREDSCRRQVDTRVIFQGECSSGQNPCSGKVCGAGEQCHVDSASEAWCICPPECPSLVRPVCGSNGRTYESECHLRRSACLEKEDVVVGRHGDCDDSGPCSDYNRCDNGGHCVVHNGLPMCACPICSEEYEPICGSDNFSYANECKLRHENCTTAKMITIRYRGRCLADVCAQKKCDFYSVCEIDSLGVGRCVCPDDCDQIMAVVCGSDGVSYNNECKLRHASCKQQKVISIASNGDCDPCDGVTCEFGGRCRHGKCFCLDDCPLTDDDVVCASDGLTYQNECAMLKAGCDQKTSLKVLHAGSCAEMSGSGDFASSCDETNCKFGGECELSLNGSIICVCNFNCDALRSPVCGSDGRTYGNECQLKEDSCRRQIAIKIQPMDDCQDIDEELCDGEPALINPISGKEFNCNRGKDVCPAGSYCHKLGAIARCCKQTDQLTEICANSQFGCCPDGVISAPGPNNAGCPNVCQCNALGSLSTTCDPVTRQCTCRPGVGGIKCDRCNPNFWGLPKIAEGGSGCLPCGCSVHGSMRHDCEQMTGQCICRPGISGRQCNTCPNGKYLRPNGCSDVMLNDGESPSFRPCEKPCSFGASCRLSDGEPECACLMNCSAEEGSQASVICASDGVTHASFCQMTLFACHSQKNVTIAHPGPCDADDVSSPAEISTSTNSRTSSNISVDADYPTDDVFIYGLLGEICHDDSDCSVANSVCDSSVCSCKASWTIASDNLSCKAIVRIPSFSGRSYIELKKLSQDGHETTIEILFRPQREIGILLYARGDTDFISVALKGGFIEFRYDLGSGPVFLRSSERVLLGMLHRVVARQSERSGSLKVNNDTEVIGTSRGSLNSLNINGPIYLGGGVEREAEKMRKVVGISEGFVGCVHSLVIKNSKQNAFSYDLTSEDSPNVEKLINIGNCASSLCVSFPCLNGGVCLETDNGADFTCRCLDGFSGVFCEEQMAESSSSCIGFPCRSNGTCQSDVGGGFRCDCLPGFTGDRCEKEIVTDVEAVAFDGFTYLQYQNAISSIKKSQDSNRFEVKFRSQSSNGLLLLMHKSNSIEADYLAVAVRAGSVQVSLNLGKEKPTEIFFLSSSVNVTDGDWHTLMFSRANHQSQLIVDHKLPVVTKNSTSGATHLDTDGHLWIGGSVHRIHGLPGAYLSGFHGCIKYVKVDNRILDLVEDREVVSGAISFCGTDRR